MSIYVDNVIGTDKIKPGNNLYFCEDCVGKKVAQFNASSIDIPVNELYIDIHKMIVECNKMEVL